MAALQHVQVVPHGGGVVEVRLDRPAKRNAMNKRLWQEVGHIFSQIIPHDSTCRCVVLTGSGKVFSSGIDLSSMGLAAMGDGESDAAQRGMRVLREGGEWQAAWQSLNNCRVPVIAAVHGGCYGAALELIAWADVRMCTEDTTSGLTFASNKGSSLSVTLTPISLYRFRAPEVDIGLAADIGGNQMLPKIIGNDSLLRELMLSGRSMDAFEALRFGLVSRILKDQETLMVSPHSCSVGRSSET